MADIQNIANGESQKVSDGSNDTKIPQDHLADLTAQATAKYAVKDYIPAAELYSQATELQAEINGEMNPDNADLIYAYARCLFYVAQKNSTVLGGPAAQVQLPEEEKKAPKKRKANGSAKMEDSGKSIPAEGPAADISTKAENDSEEQKSDKPYFSIGGDENFVDSSDEEEEDEGEEEEEEDDFATSFELLDLARVLFTRKLEEIDQAQLDSTDKGKSAASSQAKNVKDVKTRIADIYDLQAEISLESEKYTEAVVDLKSRLTLTEELEAPESEVLAECHYKLSLALEVAAQDQQRDDKGNPVGDAIIDWDGRNEAISHQQKAIECCHLRVAKEKQKLEGLSETDPARSKIQEQIEDVQEMVEQMQDRLADLKKPPVSAKATADQEMSNEMMAGVLGQMLSSNASKEEQKETLAKVIAGANDLTGMVKKKKRKAVDDTASNASGASAGSKRKVQFVDTVVELGGSGKRAKVEDTEDSGL